MVILLVFGCGGKPDAGKSAAAVCEVSAPTECPDPAPTYADVAPIFADRCASCHSGMRGGPWPLNSYGRVTDWAASVQGELENCTMPPADSGITLPPSERELILTWLLCGYPR